MKYIQKNPPKISLLFKLSFSFFFFYSAFFPTNLLSIKICSSRPFFLEFSFSLLFHILVCWDVCVCLAVEQSNIIVFTDCPISLFFIPQSKILCELLQVVLQHSFSLYYPGMFWSTATNNVNVYNSSSREPLLVDGADSIKKLHSSLFPFPVG